MPELQVQKFLRESSENYSKLFALELLKTTYFVDFKFHSICPELVLLKYNQIESDFKERIVQECRGLILDSSNNWNVVCYPFNKFHNLFESNAVSIDWGTARVETKLDGSMVCMAYVESLGEWNISTSGCPDGTNEVGDTGFTFSSLFTTVLAKYEFLPLFLNKSYTYIFELTSPLNRVVVDYKESNITLIGVRDNTTFQEIDPLDEVCRVNDEMVEEFGVESNLKIPESYPLVTVEDCIKAASKLNPLEQEGYVVVDANFNRVKIKSPAWVTLHHVKDSCSISRMAEVIRAGEYEEFLVALESYPELKDMFLDLVLVYNKLLLKCEFYNNLYQDIKDQKEFAQKALQTNVSSVLFTMRKTKLSAKNIIKTMSKNAYLKLMEVKE